MAPASISTPSSTVAPSRTMTSSSITTSEPDRAGMDHGVTAHRHPVTDEGGMRIGGDMERRAMAEPEALTDGHRFAVGTDHAVVAEPGLGTDRGGADDRASAPAPDRTGEKTGRTPSWGRINSGVTRGEFLRSRWRGPGMEPTGHGTHAGRVVKAGRRNGVAGTTRNSVEPPRGLCNVAHPLRGINPVARAFAPMRQGIDGCRQAR